MTSDLPTIALSVRQPWAWAILCAGKDIENRAWRGPNPGLAFRGRVAIHAALGMTRDEYQEGREFIDRLGWTCPDPHALIRGAICGHVDVVDVVGRSDSPWFFGPRGLVLREPETCYAVPSKGQLGYFRWAPADPPLLPEPARWMLPQPVRLAATVRALRPEPGLFD